MSAPELLTKADADLIWTAITEQTREQGKAAAHELMMRALPAAGACTRALVATIQRDGYTLYDRDGMPSRGMAARLLADALIDDQAGVSALNDQYTLAHLATSDVRFIAAKRRRLMREAVCVGIKALPDAAWRDVVDGLAGGTPRTEAAS